MRVNAAWHRKHPMPRGATRDERVVWHEAHERLCGCREVPAPLRAAVRALRSRGRKARG